MKGEASSNQKLPLSVYATSSMAEKIALKKLAPASQRTQEMLRLSNCVGDVKQGRKRSKPRERCAICTRENECRRTTDDRAAGRKGQHFHGREVRRCPSMVVNFAQSLHERLRIALLPPKVTASIGAKEPSEREPRAVLCTKSSSSRGFARRLMIQQSR